MAAIVQATRVLPHGTASVLPSVRHGQATLFLWALRFGQASASIRERIAGIEAIPVGNLGQASFAVIKQQIDESGATQWTYKVAQSKDKDGKYIKGQYEGTESVDYKALNARDVYKFDVRWTGIPLWKDASLDLAMIWGLPSTTDSQKAAAGDNPSESDLSSNSGVLLQAEYVQGNFFGGFNKLSVTYGTDGFAYVGVLNGGNHAGDSYAPGDADSWGIRVIDWGLIEQE